MVEIELQKVCEFLFGYNYGKKVVFVLTKVRGQGYVMTAPQLGANTVNVTSMTRGVVRIPHNPCSRSPSNLIYKENAWIVVRGHDFLFYGDDGQGFWISKERITLFLQVEGLCSIKHWFQPIVLLNRGFEYAYLQRKLGSLLEP